MTFLIHKNTQVLKLKNTRPRTNSYNIYTNSTEKYLNSTAIVDSNTKMILNENTCISSYNSPQFDILAYTYHIIWKVMIA